MLKKGKKSKLRKKLITRISANLTVEEELKTYFAKDNF